MYLVSCRVRTATIIFEVIAFCSEGVGEERKELFCRVYEQNKVPGEVVEDWGCAEDRSKPLMLFSFCQVVHKKENIMIKT